MTIEYIITIEGETHQIRVAVPNPPRSFDSDEMRSFVVTTAYLEHFGYLPRGVINALD